MSIHVHRLVLKSLHTLPRPVTRSFHSLSRVAVSQCNTNSPFKSGVSQRLASTDSTDDTPTTIDFFEDEEYLQSIVQATDFASLGLGGYSPPGLIQTILESLHNTAGLPWWVCIVSSTIVLRMALFPFVVRSMRSSQRTTMVQPQISELMEKAKKANLRGDTFEAEKYTMKYYSVLKKHDITPMNQFMNILVQTPFFISFFFALRGMYNAPVESLATGGILWFPNLLIPDPYFLLPLSTSITMLVSMQVSETRNAMQANPMIKYGLVGLSLMLFPITMKFPAALTLYWCTSNLFTTAVSLTITSQKVAPYFGLKPMNQISKEVAKRPKGKSAREMFTEILQSSKARGKLRALEGEKVRDIKESVRLKNYQVVVSADELDKSYAKHSNRTRPTRDYP